MVELVPMNEADFEAFSVRAIQDYAREKVAAGTWEESQALARAQQEFLRLLPQGVATSENYLFTIVNAAREPVGALWYAVNDYGAGPLAFLYQIEIAPEFRRRGYGADAMAALETKVRERGLSTIALHVFGHNQAAQELYLKTGYIITDLSMQKTLQ